MYKAPESAKASILAEEENSAGKITLELCFIAVIGVMVAASLIAALGYEFVSARTPIVILVPLIILIGVQLLRAANASRSVDVRSVLSTVARGNSKSFNRFAGFTGWMTLLLMLIFLLGHYVAIATVMFALLRVIGKEETPFSLALSAGVTVLIFLLFELVFDIELHRGAIVSIWASQAVH